MNDFERKLRMANWKATMDNAMNGDGGYMVTMDTCGRTCARCKNPSNLQRCGRCFRVFYCSKDCQRADWRHHRDICLQVTARASKGSQSQTDSKSDKETNENSEKSEDTVTSDTKTCGTCGKTSTDMKTCGRCGVTAYCSKDCQRQNWKQHKGQCKKTSKSQTQSEWEAGKMFQDFVQAMNPSMVSPSRRSSRPPLTWEQALRAVRKLHPDKAILTKLVDVTEEEDLDPVMMTSTVFLARLARPHPYVFRNAWYLQDRKEEEVRIFFYLDNDTPAPYFQWSQLDCGNFLCLEHAYIHTFLDGTTGIRVDDACDVSIIGD